MEATTRRMPGLYQSVGARRRAAMMRVRLKRDVSGCAARTPASRFERQSFGVLQMLVKIKTFANNLARRVNNHATDERARAHLSHTARRQLKRAAHHTLVKV